MEKSKLTQKIMQRLLSLEKRRVIAMLTTIVVLLALALALEWQLVNLFVTDLGLIGALDVFSIFKEDWEIIIAYGHDAWEIFSSEMSWANSAQVVIGLLLLIAFLLLSLLVFRKEKKVWQQIREYEKKKK